MEHYGNLSLKNKLLVLIISTVSIIFIIMFFIFFSTIDDFAKNSSVHEAKRIAEYYADKVVHELLNTTFIILRVTSHGFVNYKEFPIPLRKKLVDNQLDKIIRSNPNFKCVYTEWENEAILNNGDSKVRFGSNLLKEGNLIKTIENQTEQEFATSYFNMINNKTTYQEHVVGPYLYTYKETFEKLLMTTLLIPIINDGKFIGSFGIDILLQDLDNELSEVHPYEKGYLMLFSNTGVVVSHPNKSFIGKNITEVMPKREEEFHILNSIQNGNQFSFTWTDEYKNLGKTTTVFIPIQIGDNNEKKWSLGVVMPNDMIFSETNKVKFISVVICIVALLILSALIVIIATKISSSISTIITRLNKIFNIDFTKDGMVKSNNELDTINEYLNNLSVYETNLISNLISNLILQSNLITESTTKLVIILNTIIRHREDKNEKGLAVVVNEIKELSEVFDKASKEISGLIISVESHSNKVFKVMKEIISVTTKMNETTQYISSSINEIIQYVSSTSIGQQTEYKSETLQQLTKTYGSNQLSFEDDDHVVKNLTIYIKVSEDLTDYSTQLSKFAKDLYVDLKGYKKD